jgi:hypothetical protein
MENGWKMDGKRMEDGQKIDGHGKYMACAMEWTESEGNVDGAVMENIRKVYRKTHHRTPPIKHAQPSFFATCGFEMVL